MTGLIAVVLIFSIPIIAVLTDHRQKQTRLKRDMLKDQVELERLKHENFMLETEKLRLELEKMDYDHMKK
ncbi:MAG: hypothetical protein ACI35R_00950 [Bacillus sp. (in: firmicutes)]